MSSNRLKNKLKALTILEIIFAVFKIVAHVQILPSASTSVQF